MHNLLYHFYAETKDESQENEQEEIEPVFAFRFEYFSVGSSTDHSTLKFEQIFNRSSIMILLSSKFKIHDLLLLVLFTINSS